MKSLAKIVSELSAACLLTGCAVPNINTKTEINTEIQHNCNLNVLIKETPGTNGIDYTLVKTEIDHRSTDMFKGYGITNLPPNLSYFVEVVNERSNVIGSCIALSMLKEAILCNEDISNTAYYSYTILKARPEANALRVYDPETKKIVNFNVSKDNLSCPKHR